MAANGNYFPSASAHSTPLRATRSSTLGFADGCETGLAPRLDPPVMLPVVNFNQGHIPNPNASTALAWDPKALLQPSRRATAGPGPALTDERFAVGTSAESPNTTSGRNVDTSLVFQFSSNADTAAQTETASSATSTPGSNGDHTDNNSHRGAGMWIECMSNVQDRSSVQRVKRRKVDDEAGEKADAAVQSRSGGGVLGAYVKEKRKEGESLATRPAGSSAMVDLTDNGKAPRHLGQHNYSLHTGEEDDDVMLLEDPKNEEVCYGMIKTHLNCTRVPSPKPGARSIFGDSYQPNVKVILRRQVKEASWAIPAIDHTRHVIGNVDVKGSRALVPLLDSNIGLRTECRLPSQPKKAGETPGQATSRSYGLDVVLYGPLRYAKNVGGHIKSLGLTLVAPAMVEKGIRVHNPMVPENRPPAPRAYPTDVNGAFAGPSTRTVEEIRSEVMGVFDSLTRNEDLPEMEADSRITTSLLKHQKQGLFFMTEREKPRQFQNQDGAMVSFWKSQLTARREKVWSNVITGQTQKQEPAETRGGILADMMGLGKTLSILSLVSSSLDDAAAWGLSEPSQPVVPPAKPTTLGTPSSQQPVGLTPVKRNVKATLLICPLSTITNWEEQIRQHLLPDAMSYHIYHGPSRIKDVAKLAEFDLIITTYGSVSNELGARRKGKDGVYPLEELSFFRIVLDEAHMIREQNTLQFKAISRLQAQRRWAVTGTPVQNRLDDLAALLAFIRLEPFHDRGKFVRYIVEPFKACDTEIVPKLRVLVDTVTLRRLKDKIDLPPRQNLITYLDFSQEEREVYEMFARNAQDRVQVLTGSSTKTLGGNSYIHILKAILRLRLLCAHGKDLLNEDDLATLQGMTADNAIELEDSSDDEKPALSHAKALSVFSLMLETDRDACFYCGKRLGAHEGANIEAENQDDVLGYITPCYHVLCQSCIGIYRENAELAVDAVSNKGKCPACQKTTRFEYVELRQRDVDAEHAGPAKTKTSDTAKSGKGTAKYSGPHTKTRALVADLLNTKAASDANPDEPPLKSVVFSGWTSHLDLIELALKDAGVTFTRLDGTMSRNARTNAMDRFREDPAVQVILVSIMAGGLGLNLTAGNTVYVMEPQYNPAAEAQAIDRVHRLGQERPVRTIRYIMRNSFEEKMLELQDKKNKLANLSMDAKSLDKTEAAKQKLMDLRSLFK